MATLRSFIFPAIIASFLAACSRKPTSDEEALRYFNNSFEASRMTINRSTEMLLAGLESKLKDPATNPRAEIWRPKALQVKEATRTIDLYIESLKSKLLEVSDPDMEFDQAKNMNVEIGKLGEVLALYNSNLMAIDSEFLESFPDPAKMDRVDSSNIRFFPTYLFSGNISVRVAISLLNQIQNNIKVVENRMIQFCYAKSGENVTVYLTYAALLMINTMRAEAGTKLEITAGVGSFDRKAQPKVSIDGKSCIQADDGAFYFTFNAPNLPGKYKKHVRIEYMDEIGNMQTVEKDVKYSVAP